MKPIIGFLLNPDKVFYNNLDNLLIKYFVKNGSYIFPLNLSDLSFIIKRCTGDGQNHSYLLHKGKQIALNGFFSYGYMSQSNFKAYQYLINSLEKMNMPLLYSPKQMGVLSDKFMQSLKFLKYQIPVPNTGIGFGLQGYKYLANTHFPQSSILKELNDYGGDGVFSHKNRQSLINQVAKNIWNNKLSLVQQIIKDSIGKSIRVLVINGKPVAVAEYINKVKNEFKSNNNFGYDNFNLKSLMNHPKKLIYEDLALRAVKSISKENLSIAGVDILDSKEHGEVVLEVNPWPDLFDIRESTKIDVFDLLTKEFILKIKNKNTGKFHRF